jgi:hypothetical protein
MIAQDLVSLSNAEPVGEAASSIIVAHIPIFLDDETIMVAVSPWAWSFVRRRTVGDRHLLDRPLRGDRRDGPTIYRDRRHRHPGDLRSDAIVHPVIYG